jgi:hypothetical protein
MTTTTNTTETKPAAPKAAKKTKFKPMSKEDILTYALYEAYEDYDNMFSVLQYIMQDLETKPFNEYRIRNALKAIRTLMITNQCAMMDMAGLEY